ncbi:MAG TPA: helix-turn-helix transcriptional regulator [Mycobacteriales bacterium]|nr:helix-turn-helix transcriptional regulator [Mycobacteriales bacterium]
MALLRRVLGETLRGQRLRQERTLREVSTAARVSLGYLSEVERGQKEASSELLGAICNALDLRLSDVLREVSDNLLRADAAATPAAAVRPGLPIRRVPAVLPAGTPEPVVVEPAELTTAADGAEAVPVAQVSARATLEPYGGDSREVLDAVLARVEPGRVIAA